MPLSARRHVRKMRGGAQSHLLEADDGHCYVVKFRNNPQHRRVLVNELVASVLLRYLQLSTPETALIRVSEEFLAQNPEVYLMLGSQRIPVEPGWHFGSRYPGDPMAVTVYDFVPDSLLEQVYNLDHFFGILAFDKWVVNSDGRQCIFFRAKVEDWSAAGGAQPARPGFVASMVDHGFVFNGPNWKFADSAVQGLYARRHVYERVRSLDDFEPWLEQIVHFPEEVIDQAYKQVPPQWVEGEENEFERLLEKLLERRKRVPGLVNAARSTPANPFPNWR